MRKAVYICCNDAYVFKSVVALNQFEVYNPDYDKILIGTKYSDESKKLCEKYNIKTFEINLEEDFNDLDKRPYSRNYPIECFYHFYSYKLLSDYDYILQTEADIYTNKKINIKLEKIKHIAGSYSKNWTIDNFKTLNNDFDKIKKLYWKGDRKQERICGGIKIYNVKGLEKINFYDKIVEYYKACLKHNMPRCGDDSLEVFYQLLNPQHILLLPPEFHVIIFYNLDKDIKTDDVTFFHFGGPTKKYWEINIHAFKNLKPMQKYFYLKMIIYIYKNYSMKFIQEKLPEVFKNKIQFMPPNNIKD